MMYYFNDIHLSVKKKLSGLFLLHLALISFLRI